MNGFGNTENWQFTWRNRLAMPLVVMWVGITFLVDNWVVFTRTRNACLLPLTVKITCRNLSFKYMHILANICRSKCAMLFTRVYFVIWMNHFGRVEVEAFLPTVMGWVKTFGIYLLYGQIGSQWKECCVRLRWHGAISGGVLVWKHKAEVNGVIQSRVKNEINIIYK